MLRSAFRNKSLRIRQIRLGMGADAVEGGEGLIEHRNDPLLLCQRVDKE